MAKTRTYFCIDMKSFYASVECAERGYNPFETNLVVADLTRGKNALCLAITPAMKEGSGLVAFAKEFPNRFFDVAIAEQHAATFAAGLAADLRDVAAAERLRL